MHNHYLSAKQRPSVFFVFCFFFRFLRQKTKRHNARQFLDVEAELSNDEEGADVSSDEEDGKDLDRSLEGFVVNNTHLTQELNGLLTQRSLAFSHMLILCVSLC